MFIYFEWNLRLVLLKMHWAILGIQYQRLRCILSQQPFKISAAVGMKLEELNLSNEIKIASTLQSCRTGIGITQYMKENALRWHMHGLLSLRRWSNVEPTVSNSQNDVVPKSFINIWPTILLTKCQHWHNEKLLSGTKLQRVGLLCSNNYWMKWRN